MGGTGDKRLSVSLSAGRPSGVKVCPDGRILGFLEAVPGASKLGDSRFLSPKADNFFSPAPLPEAFGKPASPGLLGLVPSANRSPGGNEPKIIFHSHLQSFDKM